MNCINFVHLTWNFFNIIQLRTNEIDKYFKFINILQITTAGAMQVYTDSGKLKKVICSTRRHIRTYVQCIVSAVYNIMSMIIRFRICDCQTAV